MRAAWYTKNGEARDVMMVGEWPTPTPAAGEVLVRLATSGVNPSDVKSRRTRTVTKPVIPHSDGAGVIEAVRLGVPTARVGERVWVWNGQWNRPYGTAAEAIALPSAQAVALPNNTDFAAGACFGIPLLTALQAVHLAGDIRGKQVLVTGASSAVGHYITQLVTLAGGHVIGTVGSDTKAAHARAGGAGGRLRDLLAHLPRPGLLPGGARLRRRHGAHRSAPLGRASLHLLRNSCRSALAACTVVCGADPDFLHWHLDRRQKLPGRNHLPKPGQTCTRLQYGNARRMV